VRPLGDADADTVDAGQRHLARTERHEQQSAEHAGPGQPRPPAAYPRRDAEEQHGQYGGADAQDARQRVPLVELSDDRDLVDLPAAGLAGRGRAGHRVEPVAGGGQPQPGQEEAAEGARHLGPELDEEHDREHDDEERRDHIRQPEEDAGRLTGNPQFTDVRVSRRQARPQRRSREERAVAGGSDQAGDRGPGDREPMRRGAGRRSGSQLHPAYLPPQRMPCSGTPPTLSAHGCGLPSQLDKPRQAGQRTWL
jgi:hypothetical protein